jgi:hypothetical protein
MPPLDLAVLTEGNVSKGMHWILWAGGTSGNFYTLLETVYPDGHRDQGGMGGPLLYPGYMMNTYIGGPEREWLKIIVRAAARVALVRVQLASGDRLDLPLLATDPDLGMSFFATLLPQTALAVSVMAIDAEGRALESQELGSQEATWHHFLRDDGYPEA